MKAKSILIVFLLFFQISTLSAYNISGTVKNVLNGKVVLSYSAKGNIAIRDSAVISNGTFMLEGTIADPSLAHVIVYEAGSPKGATAGFVLEEASIKIV